jgi:hypothetical protein
MAEEQNKSIPDPNEAKVLAENLAKAGERLADLREDAILSNNAFADMVNNISQAAKDGEEFTSAMKNSASAVKGIQNEAKIIARLDKDKLKSEKALATASKAQARLKGKIAELDSQIKVLSDARVTASDKERRAINRTLKQLNAATSEASRLAKNFEEVADAAQKINEESNFFDKMAGFAKDIPGLSKVFGEFETAAKSAREAAAQGGNAMVAGGKSLLGAVSKMALAFTVGKVTKGLIRTNETLVDMQRNFNMSYQEADKLDDRFIALGKATKSLTSKEMLATQHAISDAMGVTADLSDDTLVAFGTMTKKLGISAEEAAKLAQFTAASGTDLKTFNDNLVGQVKLQNVSNKSAVRYQDIMKDVASASAATQLTTQKFPGGIAKAAYQARKLGLSFNQLNSAGDSLLDFESSLASEMEAELMLGRDINLDKARAAALSGDQATLAAELAREMGSAKEFGALNVLQQNALAKSMGMSREEVAETLIKQEAINKLGGDQSKSLDEAVKKQYEKALLIKDEEKREAALSKIRGTAGAEELLRQLETKTAAEAQAELQQEMTESVKALGDPLKTIAGFFSKMTEYSGIILTTVGAIGALSIFKKFKGLLKVFKSLTKGAKGLKSVLGMGGKVGEKTLSKTVAKTGGKNIVKTAGKVAAKTVGTSLLKKIPIIGALAGVGFAISRAAKGDYAGAALELASGAASIIPGIGTAASVAIDAGLAARDISQSRSRSAGTMEVDDFTIKSNPKDTITMAGGTKLGGNVEKLLEELISLVKSGGNVYLDGSKVGEALVLSSRLST